MEWWQAVILGLVEGITEYLPVSSTGHLIITSSLLGLDSPDRKNAVDAFNIVIQGGAILAVLGLYWPRVIQMIKGVLGRDAAGLRLAVAIMIAFVPAAVLGVLLDDWIEARLFSLWPVTAALVLGGVFMIVLDRGLVRRHREAERAGDGSETSGADRKSGDHRSDGADDDWIRTLTPGRALAIGLLQCIAMWPGTSRSMMTIVGGVLVGLRPRHAAEFSFLLGLPTLGGACVYKLYKNISAAKETGAPNMVDMLGWGSMAIGIACATVAAAVAVRGLVAFLNRHGLEAFGWYRIALGVLLAALALSGLVTFTHG